MMASLPHAGRVGRFCADVFTAAPSPNLCPTAASASGVLAAPRRKVLLPVASVDRRDRDLVDGAGIEAARVHAVTIRMRARYVERFDSAHRTEKVLRRARI